MRFALTFLVVTVSVLPTISSFVDASDVIKSSDMTIDITTDDEIPRKAFPIVSNITHIAEFAKVSVMNEADVSDVKTASTMTKSSNLSAAVSKLWKRVGKSAKISAGLVAAGVLAGLVNRYLASGPADGRTELQKLLAGFISQEAKGKGVCTNVKKCAEYYIHSETHQHVVEALSYDSVDRVILDIYYAIFTNDYKSAIDATAHLANINGTSFKDWIRFASIFEQQIDNKHIQWSWPVFRLMRAVVNGVTGTTPGSWPVVAAVTSRVSQLWYQTSPDSEFKKWQTIGVCIQQVLAHNKHASKCLKYAETL